VVSLAFATLALAAATSSSRSRNATSSKLSPDFALIRWRVGVAGAAGATRTAGAAGATGATGTAGAFAAAASSCRSRNATSSNLSPDFALIRWRLGAAGAACLSGATGAAGATGATGTTGAAGAFTAAASFSRDFSLISRKVCGAAKYSSCSRNATSSKLSPDIALIRRRLGVAVAAGATAGATGAIGAAGAAFACFKVATAAAPPPEAFVGELLGGGAGLGGGVGGSRCRWRAECGLAAAPPRPRDCDGNSVCMPPGNGCSSGVAEWGSPAGSVPRTCTIWSSWASMRSMRASDSWMRASMPPDFSSTCSGPQTAGSASKSRTQPFLISAL